MIIILKIAAIIALLLVLVRLKWNLGIALVLDSILTALLFGLNFRLFARNLLYAVVSKESWNLIGIIILVVYLGNFLQRGGHFKTMVDALKNLVRDPRLILAIPSAFIGLLPMMAGAMMGAPIVEEAAQRWDLSPSWKTFLNYWFRHIWEYSWPLYVNLILAAAIVNVPIMKICLVQFPFTLVAATAGLVMLFRHVPYLPGEKDTVQKRFVKDSLTVVLSIWPIVLTIILIFAFRLPMLISLAIAGALTLILTSLPVRERLEIVLKSLSPRMIILIVALVLFKRTLEVSGALDSVVRVVGPEGFSAYVLLFAAPFFVGLLTGVNQAFPAIAFPLLVPIMGRGHPDMALVMFAYVSGFVGILLSPAHLCLALTADYFKAPLRDVYKILIWPVAAVFGSAVAGLILFHVL